jgi:hypothetical protein
MTRYIFFLMIVLGSLPGFSQKEEEAKAPDKQKNVYIDVLAGASFPLGSYAKTDKKNDKAGYATTGYFFQANVDWLGSHDFGLAFQYCYQHNPYTDSAEKIIPYGTLYPLGDKGWSNNYFLGGPVFLRSFNKITADVKILGGVVFSSSTVFNITDPVTKQNKNNTATGFAYQFGIGIGYNFTPKATIRFNLSYIGSSTGIDKKYQSYYPGDSTTGNQGFLIMSEISIKKIISTVNTGVGIIFKL